MMRSLFRLSAYLLGGLLVVAVGLGAWAYFASQQVPEFYQQALEIEEKQLEEASEVLETQALELYNRVSNADSQPEWEALFTAKQINGWLAVGLKQNHSDALPPQFSDPRVAISPEGAKVACRYETDWIKTIASLTLDVYLAEKNVLAMRIKNARAGTLPLPLGSILEAVSKGAKESNIRLRWMTVEGDPVAMITIPAVRDGSKVVVSIGQIELREGAVYLRGKTLPKGAAASAELTQLPFKVRLHR